MAEQDDLPGVDDWRRAYIAADKLHAILDSACFSFWDPPNDIEAFADELEALVLCAQAVVAAGKPQEA